VDQVDKDGDNPNVAINYNHPDGTLFWDYRPYDTSQVKIGTKRCDLKFGPSTLTGDWKTYDIHIEPEPDKKVVMEGKSSTKHESRVDLHVEAQVQPFRPGTGYISFGVDDTYYYNFICITKLTVTGRIAIDGESKHVTGSAYYNHQWFNISPISAFHHKGSEGAAIRQFVHAGSAMHRIVESDSVSEAPAVVGGEASDG
jgi:hypothetical protein